MKQFVLAVILSVQLFASSTVTIMPISDTICITVTSFENRNVFEDTHQQLKPLHPTKARAIIIDLRGNSGGYIHEAIEFSALFVNTSPLIDLIDHNDTMLSVTRPKHHPFIQTRALIIVVGPNTASSAEAAAYILAKHPKATIIGKQSYGKTSIESKSSSSPYKSFDINASFISPDQTIDILANASYESQILQILASVDE